MYPSAPPEEYIRMRDMEGSADYLLNYIPTIMVSVGIMATFIGLGLAIDEASGIIRSNSNADPSALLRVLGYISFKFQTSVYGIFLSVIFNVTVVREQIRRIDRVEGEAALELYASRVSTQLLIERLEVTSRAQSETNAKLADTLERFSRTNEDVNASMRETLEKLATKQNALIEDSIGRVISSTSDLDKNLNNVLTDALSKVNGVIATINDTQTATAVKLQSALQDLQRDLNKAMGDLAESISVMNTNVGGQLEKIKAYIHEFDSQIKKQNDTMGRFESTMVMINDSIKTLAEVAGKLFMEREKYAQTVTQEPAIEPPSNLKFSD
jgi:hypothetical protein